MLRAIFHRLHREWMYLRGAYQRWNRDDGTLMAAAVAYYVGLSFFPLLLVLLAGFGLFLRYTQPGQNAEAELLDLVATNLSQPLHDHIARALSLVRDRSTVSGPVGLLGILLASLAGFVQFDRAFDRIWGVPRRQRPGFLGTIKTVLIKRGIAFLLLISAGLLIVLVFVAGLVLSALQTYTDELVAMPTQIWSWAHMGVTLVLNAVVFTLLYRWLSKIPVRWRDAGRGGILAALLWEVGRLLLTAFLLKTSYGSAYGVIGSFIAILLWCYYIVAVVFFGAEYIQEFRHSRNQT